MECKNYTNNNRKYQHIKYSQRVKLEYMLKNKKKLRLTIKHMAQELGVSERTIYREKKRGLVKGLLNSDLTKRDEYIADYSQEKYDNNMKEKGGKLKIGKNIKLSQYIEKSIIEEKNSPYVALEKAKKEAIGVNICLKTIYNYVDNEIFINLTRNHLPYQKKYKKRYNGHKRIRKIGGVSIEERPKVINDRLELGHFEMDTVLGKRGNKSCLLVLTERVSRKQIIIKLPEKKSEYVIAALMKIQRKYPKTFKDRFKSITSDNGSEFMNAQAVESLGIKYFYAHSYCSHERGSNENNNKLIRRFIKKGDDIGKWSKRKIQKIEDWMNNYPRKMFNGKSANEIYLDFRVNGVKKIS